jgi:lycopene beta-cyclase
MGNIFFKVFNSKPKTAINFLSNKSNFFEDLEVILKMPKWRFLKELI